MLRGISILQQRGRAYADWSEQNIPENNTLPARKKKIYSSTEK